MRKKVCLRLPKWLYDGYFEPGDRLPPERDLVVELGLLRKPPAAHAGPDGASARLLRHVGEWHFRRRVRRNRRRSVSEGNFYAAEDFDPWLIIGRAYRRPAIFGNTATKQGVEDIEGTAAPAAC
ncbi:MAG: GntR family transcriptional regulator [Mesorhizobium sp.]|nr:MAG: GntR family transcriptional regulator [Mesorhizobium sp.]RWK17556.1 MAG: GntR family transcriptional regulator [Mesorhizobium sp.]RWK27050.1 MAG: GntR family transcriptional regulator [Mesorhizobium sp.]TIQ36800.1 MAG: GntR family transcriptional regulator [Mesorhizobium sp.]